MGTGDAMAFATTGGWRVFDQARGIADHIQELMEKEPAPIEFHGDHLYDADQERRDELARAKQLLDDDELILQKVLAEV